VAQHEAQNSTKHETSKPYEMESDTRARTAESKVNSKMALLPVHKSIVDFENIREYTENNILLEILRVCSENLHKMIYYNILLHVCPHNIMLHDVY